MKLDDLIEKHKEFELVGRVVKVTEMGLEDYMEISSWLTTVIHKLPSRFKEKTNAQDILAIIKSVSIEEAATLFSIVLKMRTDEDKQFITKHILSSMRVTAEVVNIVCDANGFDKTFESFKRAGEKMSKLKNQSAEKNETTSS